LFHMIQSCAKLRVDSEEEGVRADPKVSRGDALVVGARAIMTPRPSDAAGVQETSMARAQTHWSSRRTDVAYRVCQLRLLINRSLRENLPYHNKFESLRYQATAKCT
jgi:hypothetical protein